MKVMRLAFDRFLKSGKSLASACGFVSFAVPMSCRVTTYAGLLRQAPKSIIPCCLSDVLEVEECLPR